MFFLNSSAYGFRGPRAAHAGFAPVGVWSRPFALPPHEQRAQSAELHWRLILRESTALRLRR